jgi:hypothetical protein
MPLPQPNFEYYQFGFTGTDIGSEAYVIVAVGHIDQVGPAVENNLTALGSLLADFIENNSAATSVTVSNIVHFGVDQTVYP